MKNIKRLIFILAITTMLICTLSVSAAAAMTVSTGDVEAYAGETVTVPVKVSSNAGFVSASIYVEFDDSVLTLTGVQNMSLIDGAAHTTRFTSPYILSWENDTKTSNYISNGTLAELVFTVSSFAELGDYDITISIPTHGILNSDGSEVDCSVEAGAITVLTEECSHEWGDWKKSSSTRHKRSCDLCGEVEYDSHEWDDGEVTEEPTADSTGMLIYTCDICSGIKTSIIPALEPDEYKITGTVTSYGDADEAVTVILYDAYGIEIDSYTTTDGTYTLSAPDGTYTLEVSKLNHVTREYEIIIDGNEVTQDVKINLLGDVNGDGSVTNRDRLILARYLADWEGYDITMIDPNAADVNCDGMITNRDRLILARYLAEWEGYEVLPIT